MQMTGFAAEEWDVARMPCAASSRAGMTLPCSFFNNGDLPRMQAFLQDGMLQAGECDVLIGHMLGLDHAGHTFGVQSAEMQAKIAQNDAEILQVHSVWRRR